MTRSSAFAAAVLLTAPAFAATPVTYQIDSAHSTAAFTVKHMMVTNVHGEFGKVNGTVTYDKDDPTKSTVEATIDATTLSTRNDARDKDVRGPNFLDVEKYPDITFKSTKVQKAGKDGLKVTGDLTLHGVTKPVVLQVEGPSPEIKDPMGGTRTGLHATTRINRKDYGVAFNKTLDSGGAVVGDQINIELDVELTKPAPAKTAESK